MTVRVSVVVPTFKRPAQLERCLRALLAQDFDPAAYEIIVADDAASHATRAQVERVVESKVESRKAGVLSQQSKSEVQSPKSGVRNRQSMVTGSGLGPSTVDFGLQTSDFAPRTVQRPSIRYIPVTGNSHGPAAARNRGWRAAQGHIIAFTDDDCIPAPDWLRAGVAGFVNGTVGVRGRIIVPVEGRPTDYERSVAALSGAEFVTANCFYRRDALAAVGGFDERFTAAWREDSDLYFALLERHGADRFACVEQALVVHPVRPAPWGVSLRLQRKSFFNALLYRKHPALYRERIQPEPPWHYYATLAALAGTLLAALARRPRPAAIGAAAWLLLTGLFAARRLKGTSRASRHVAEMLVTSAVIPLLSIYWRLRGAVSYRVWFL